VDRSAGAPGTQRHGDLPRAGRRGFTFAYNSVKRFCRGLRQREPEQLDRLEFLRGEESQVDYGEGALTLHPKSGKYRKPRLPLAGERGKQ
jgi:hypothetical protein